MKSPVIWKYEGVIDPTLGMVHFNDIPAQSTIIRKAWVDDGFYKGYFIWAIVDRSSKDPETERLELTFTRNDFTDSVPQLSEIETSNDWRRLKIKETQTVVTPRAELLAIAEDDGELYVTFPIESDIDDEVVELVAYKTGQDITINLDEYSYIGLGRIWIVQELGLYFFASK